jgi:hypothetical protein
MAGTSNRFRPSVLALAGLLIPIPIAHAAAPYKDPLSSATERQRVLAEMRSGEPARVNTAVAEVRTCGTLKGHAHPTDLQLFIKAGRYDDLESAAMQGMLDNAVNSETMAAYEMVRARGFMAGDKPTEALAAAKAYYNLAMLKDTSAAISMVSLALIAAHPDDPGIASRFKAQQLASADTSATTRPDLGDPILASIKIDEPELENALAQKNGVTFPALVERGNLLLATDHCDKAREIFEAAVDLAGPPQLSHAIENVARAVRAQTGQIGPANEYLASLANKPK